MADMTENITCRNFVGGRYLAVFKRLSVEMCPVLTYFALLPLAVMVRAVVVLPVRPVMYCSHPMVSSVRVPQKLY